MTPVHTPQFSPIENMFGRTKQLLKEYLFKTKEEAAMKISELMFGYDKLRI